MLRNLICLTFTIHFVVSSVCMASDYYECSQEDIKRISHLKMEYQVDVLLWHKKKNLINQRFSLCSSSQTGFGAYFGEAGQ
jgi:hypothetical protein